MKKLCFLLSLLLLLTCLASACDSGKTSPSDSESQTSGETEPPADALPQSLNGHAISEYVIVYSDEAPDYNLRAAEYLKTSIEARTGVVLSVVEDDTAEAACEIVVGETNRAISAALDAETEHTQFAFLADGTKVAMEGDYFIIAAAAYYFIETYVTDADFVATIAEEVTVCEPIVEKANNYIFLIGDGMGEYQTKLFEIMDVPTKGDSAFSDGEDVFYGYYFPAMGWSKTLSMSGITDSAAGGTALACGYKTLNDVVGQDNRGYPIDSLTEIAAYAGKATAVMSTEPAGGATPASFSAHVTSRASSNGIKLYQKNLTADYGTIFRCDYDVYTVAEMPTVENAIKETLDALSQDEDGFFLMYEEAYIDKHCHSNNIDSTFLSIMRFNQAIGLFMEYAFYNPDTFVLITADHETGALRPNDEGGYSYHSVDHSADNVPVFVYGMDCEIFDGVTMENAQIPNTIAMTFWGEEAFGDPKYAPLSHSAQE